MTKPLRLVALLCLCLMPLAGHAQILRSELHDFEISVITDDLHQPWGMAFLPSGDILVTELAGQLRIVKNDKLVDGEISGLPPSTQTGQGGLMGIAVHPQFAENRWVYLSHAVAGRGGVGTEVIRGRLGDMELFDVVTIFRALPKSRGGRHFGSRLTFAADGKLFISLGERGDRSAAQDLNDHRGALIRVNDDGSVPADNPFAASDARHEIYSYGHRNIQGMTRHPTSDLIWTHEHGPQGGDEVNIIQPGANYGWPVITYGVNYGIGTKIGEGTHRSGLEQPVHVWVPSIAPSGMAFYTGAEFSRWQGDLFVGSLKFGLLVRLDVEADSIVGEERMLDNEYGRIRDVVQGPDGYIYLLAESGGLLMRVVPAGSGT